MRVKKKYSGGKKVVLFTAPNSTGAPTGLPSGTGLKANDTG